MSPKCLDSFSSLEYNFLVRPEAADHFLSILRFRGRVQARVVRSHWLAGPGRVPLSSLSDGWDGSESAERAACSSLIAEAQQGG
jgi:hypothetical protein